MTEKVLPTTPTQPSEKIQPTTARVATVGVFDGVHLGHRHLLECTRAVAKSIEGHHGASSAETVAVTFDRHPLSLIAPDRCPAMLTTAADRDRLLREAGAEDIVCLTFDDSLRRLTAAEFVRLLAARYGITHLVMGYDHSFGSDSRGVSFDHYRDAGLASGVAVIRADRYTLPDSDTVVSSSAIRRILAAGDVAGAAAMLGRPHTVTGRVVSGKHLGSRIGFPTANIAVPDDIVLPAGGVYAARCTADGSTYPAMVNIGTCPTVSSGAPVTVEAHLIGYDGDLYGRDLSVAFVHRLRDERRFDSVEALTARLAADRDAAIRALS